MLKIFKKLNKYMCEHKTLKAYTPFLKCADCGMVACANCKLEWKEGHSCAGAHSLQAGDAVKVTAKFGK